MTDSNKRPPTILGGASLRDKLSKAKKELDALQVDDDLNVMLETTEIPVVAMESTKDPIFHLTGRCNRKNQKYNTKAFYILDGLEQEIKSYCSGGDVALFNYLMHLGLLEIKRREGHSFDEISKMEAHYIK